jgi:glycosyltransferase involved in cell wall biosynthesis
MNLILFFSYGVSLKTWHETGLLDREALFYKRILEEDINVKFLTYGNDLDYQYKNELGNIKITPFYSFANKPSKKYLRLVHALLLPIILRKEIKNADSLKTNQMSGSWVAVLSKLLFRKKLIVRCGFEWYRFIQRQSNSIFRKLIIYIIEWISYHFADGIILAAEDDKDFVNKRFMIRTNEKVKVIPNYIEVEIFKPMFGEKKKNNHLLFIGRLTKQKNLFNLLKAIEKSKYTLHIIGDGELKKELEAFCTQHQININFLGQFPNNEIPKIINQYEVFILPSYYEGNPKTLLEAMSCGLSVIGTEVEGIKNIIEHKVNGYLCQTDSVSIRAAIDKVMSDAPLRIAIGQAARQYIIKFCSLDIVLKKELNFYNRFLGSKY